MEPEPLKKRLDALDGLRGVAIILVLLSHLNLNVLFDKGSNLLLKTIFDSGEIGVSILFILSGFLMAYLYPQPKSTLGFLQKRYTRIFPAFIAVCTLLTVVAITPQITDNIQESLKWLFGISLIFYLVWVYVIKKLPTQFGKTLFLSFILLQILVGAFYLLWVMRMDYTQYIESIPELTRTLITFMVNATLTLPLGTYSGPLSSVYWSLGTEVYFYILYPIIAVPFISIAAKTNKKTKLILLASTLPLFIGLYYISQKFLFFKLLHLELAYYFVGGLSLGYIYRNKILNLDGKKSKILSALSIPLFIGTIIIYHALLIALPTPIDPLLKTVFTLPFTILVLITLMEKTWLAKVFTSRLLIYIGTISYSMYLIHMFVFEVLKKQLGEPTDFMNVTWYVLLSVASAIIVASGMYYLLEKPYFKKRKNQSDSNNNEVKTASPKKQTITKTLFAITLIYVITTFFSYNSDFKLFSLQSRHQTDILMSPQDTNQSQLSLKENPLINAKLTAKNNNLAVIELDLSGKNAPNEEFKKQTITARLKETGTENWQETSFVITSRDDTLKNLFGFAPIPDSKNKSYDLQIELDEPNSSHQITINTSNELLKAHYTLNKSEFIKSPTQITAFILDKIIAISTNPTAQISFLFYLPFLLTCLYIINKVKK